MDDFYEKNSSFDARQNIRWNKWITENKEYIPYNEFLFLYCDEDLELEDPRYECAVVVATEGADICDLL